DVCEFFNRDAGLAAGPPEMPLLQFVKCIMPLLTMQPLQEARERLGVCHGCARFESGVQPQQYQSRPAPALAFGCSPQPSVNIPGRGRTESRQIFRSLENSVQKPAVH